MKLSIWPCFLILFVAVQCKPTPGALTVTVAEPIMLENVPSGSGMVSLSDSIYILSDDAPYLFHLSREYQIIEKIRITPGFDDVFRIEKPLKPDFECLAVYEAAGKSLLYGFGSGSLAVKRDSLVVVDLENEAVKTHNLSELYDKLSLIAGGNNRERLNIEGAAIHDEKLYLLNRGTNSVFVLEMDAFNGYLAGERTFSSLQVERFELPLPTMDGNYIGLSGCTLIPGTSTMVFTATVEATTDWVADGEILGSYVGIISLDELHQNKAPLLVPFESNNEPLMEKIESISITVSEGNGVYSALTIADNDDGTSKIYPVSISVR